MGNFSVNPFSSVGCVALGWLGTRGPCGQGGEDNYGGKTSIIYARLSLEEHSADILNSIHQCSDAGCCGHTYVVCKG